MKKLDLKDYIRGWVVGDFEPTLIKKDFEVGVKRYKAGESEERHYHLTCVEYTIIVSGRVLMNGVEYTTDDIVEIRQGEDTDFQCLDDAITVVIKTSSIKGDKYKK